MPGRPHSPAPRPKRRRRITYREQTSSTTRLALGGVVFIIAAGMAGIWWWTRPERLRAQAVVASRAGNWAEALIAWRGVNATRLARGATFLAEARAALALGRASEAEKALKKASNLDPTPLEPWRLRLEILRLEDRPLEAQDVGWAAYDAVNPASRREVLEDLTLALLADLKDDIANPALTRWSVAGDGNDPDARVALLRRLSAMSHADDPPRDDRIAELNAILKKSPGHLDAREVLITALADAGEPEAGRKVLDAWPGDEPARDSRYWRLRGRWDLDFDHNPAQAIEAFRRTLTDLPHDWKTRFRLARALRAAGREPEAREEAEAVGRTRELLDPARLGLRLAADFQRRDDPKALNDLADLCARAGLTRLAEAWSREADQP